MAGALFVLLLAVPALASWANLNNEFVLVQTNSTFETKLNYQHSNSLRYCRDTADCTFTETYGVQTYGGEGYTMNMKGEFALSHWNSRMPGKYPDSTLKEGKIDVCLKSRGGSSYIEKLALQCRDYVVLADASESENNLPKLSYYKIEKDVDDDYELLYVDVEDVEDIEVSQANMEGKPKLFIKCATAFGSPHTVKLTYSPGVGKIDVTAFLATRDVRNMVNNGLCQKFPGGDMFNKCGDWGSSYESKSIEYPGSSASSKASFAQSSKGPKSCKVNGLISKIGEHKGMENFCSSGHDNAQNLNTMSSSKSSACEMDLSSCSELCHSHFLNNAPKVDSCKAYAQEMCVSCNSLEDINVLSSGFKHE